VFRDATDVAYADNSTNIKVYLYGVAYYTDVELTVLNALNNLKTLIMRNM
jgi:hypothetical protein